MKKAVFTGAAVALVSPFHKDGSINYGKLEELIDYQIENSTDAIVVCATTGESPTLSYEEHEQIVRRCVEHVAGRVPVIAGTGSNDTKNALKLSNDAERAGADGLLMVTPYYNKTSQAGLIEHFNFIADRVSIISPYGTHVSFLSSLYHSESGEASPELLLRLRLYLRQRQPA